MRSDIEIIGDLLNVANGGSIKTHLRGRTNLDNNTFERYEALTIGLGLLERGYEKASNHKKNRAMKEVYRATGRGLAYAHYYNKLMDLLGDNEEYNPHRAKIPS